MGEEVEANTKRSEAYLVIPTNEVRESIWDTFFFFFPFLSSSLLEPRKYSHGK